MSPSTQDTYRRDLKRYILPRVAAHWLGRLPAGEIESGLNDEIAAGLAPSSVHRHYRTLRRVLQVAAEEGEDPAQPVTGSSRLGSRSGRWSREQAVDLAEAVGVRYRVSSTASAVEVEDNSQAPDYLEPSSRRPPVPARDGTLILFESLDALDLLAEPVITAVTLAELGRAPVADDEDERAARQLRL